MIFLQKSFLFIRSEEELGRKKKKDFWRWPSKTGMKYKFDQSNLIFFFYFSSRMFFCIGVIEGSEYWVISDYSNHHHPYRKAGNEVRPLVPEKLTATLVQQISKMPNIAITGTNLCNKTFSVYS